MRVGLLGAGNIAGTMAATLRGMKAGGEDVELYAVASRSQDKAEAFAREQGVQKAFGSYADMLKDDKVDLVYVATPHSHHAEHMKLCIEHGKAILCEKAFTGNARQAEEILNLAEQKKIPLTEAIWTRYQPARKIMDDVIASGKIGEVKLVTNTDPFDEEVAKAQQAAAEKEANKCKVCGICPFHPFGVCMFIWIAILLVIVLIVLYNVRAHSKKKKREAEIKAREEASRATRFEKTESIFNTDRIQPNKKEEEEE